MIVVVSAMACWLTRGRACRAADTEADDEDALIRHGISCASRATTAPRCGQLERAYDHRAQPARRRAARFRRAGARHVAAGGGARP